MKTQLNFLARGGYYIIILSLFLLSYSLNAQTILTVGTGTSTNSSTGYPAPYGNYYWGAKNQMMITAAELSALGGASGTLNSIAFNVATVKGVPLTGFTIKVGTTTDAALSSFVTGLTQVYTAASYTEVAGWNTHTFTTPYQWDGVSNLVIETCFNNSDWTNNALTYYSTTSFNSAIYHRDDNANVCSSTSITAASPDRPNMQLSLSMVPQTNDLAMVSWDSPMSPMAPNATAPISIKLRNAGIAAIDTFDISYSIDGGATYVVEAYNGTLNAGDTLAYTFMALANFPNGAYNCIAAVNNGGDTLAYNDSLTYTLYSGDPLNGTYSIGTGATDDFSTIGNAVTNLELYGVTGPVVFSLDAGIYNEQVSITGPIHGMSIINDLKFKGQGDATIISTSNTSSSDRDVFRINGQSYITLDSISFVANGTTSYNSGIRIMGSDSITVKNCNITVPINTSSYTNGILVSGSMTSNYTATEANYLTLDGNTIYGGNSGIKMTGVTTAHSVNININNNTLTDYRYYGIYTKYQDSVIITNNTMTDNGTSGYGYSLYFYKNNLGSTIANNSIVSNFTSTGYGMYVNYSEGSVANPIMIYNNMVVSTQATGSCYGIYTYFGKNINYYYNTVALNSGGTSSSAMYIRGGTYTPDFKNIKFKNNIFSNKGQGYATYFYETYYPAKITEMDYNNLFVSDTTKFLRMGSDFTNLTAWQAAAAGLDANSVSVDPLFASNTDGHAASIPMNNFATPIAGINTDIDGDVRDLITPDMGADEYIPPADEVEILSYIGSGVNCGLTNSEVIKVVIRNNGTNTQNSFAVKYSINGGTIITETLSSFSSLAVDTFEFATTTDLSAAGLYDIVVYTDLIGDLNRNNDTVFASVTSIATISNFVYFQDFEDTVLDFGASYGSDAMASISEYAAKDSAKGLLLTGGTSSNWSNYSTVTGAFENETHVASFTACDVDASALSTLNMSFDMKMNATYNTTYGWFRVMLNDTVYLKDINGDSTWNAENTGGNDEFKNLRFNLDMYAGTQFSLSLQSACKYNNNNYGGDYGDEVFIDNLKMWETAPHDLAITEILSPLTTTCENAVAPVEVVLSNNGLNAEANVPVFVIITDPNGVSTTFSSISSITLGGIDTVIVGVANTTAYGIYSVKAYASLATDTMYNDNDTMMSSFEIYAPFAIDHVETFEDLNNWTSGMNLGNDYMRYNFHNGNSVYTEMNRKIGYIAAGDMLVFDYQIVDYSTGDSIILDQDSMFFMISNDCGVSFDTIYTVESTVHTGTVEWTHKQFPLTSYIGDNIIIAFGGVHGNNGSDMYFNIDNYGIASSPMVSLGVDTFVCVGDIVMLDAGYNSGYNYLWTVNGDTLATTSNTINAIDTGTYIVNVTNQIGVVYDTIVVSNYINTSLSISGLKSNYILSNAIDTLIGTPAGGVFSGPGMNGAVFDHINVGVGIYDITYTYTDTNGCVSSDSSNTIVNNYISPINLSSSGNVYGYLVEQCTPLTANEDIDVIHFTHRADPSVMGSSTGDIISSQSRDGGDTWTHLMAFPNDSAYNNRYPSGVIYNPPGNTNADSAYIITVGPSHNGASTDVWQNIFMGSMRLDSTHIDHQYMPTYGAIARMGLQSTSNGRFHVMATNYTGSYIDTIRLIEGEWDNTNNKVNWSETKFQASFVVDNGATQVNTEFNTAWSEDGSVGYYWTMGRDVSLDLRSFQPIVWKSIDSGSTWAKMPIFDFGSLTDITNHLYPMKGVSPATSRPVFSSHNDGTVDANGNLHIIAKVKAASSNHNDSLLWTYRYANSLKTNPIFDIYTSSVGWNAVHIGDVAAGDVSATASAYGEAWDLRLQASRTVDGTKIFGSWADSDTSNTDIYYLGNPINKYPNIIAAGYDIINFTKTSQKNFTIGTTISDACHFHNMSDVVLSDTGVYTIPMSKLDIGVDEVSPVHIKYIKGIQFTDSDFVDTLSFPKNNYDLKITNIETPTICEDSQIVSATIINMGRMPLNVVQIGVDVNGNIKNDFIKSGLELNYLDSTIITLDYSFKPTPNINNDITLFVKSINNLSDENNSNDTLTLNKYYYMLPIITYINPLKSNYCINDEADSLSVIPYGGVYSGYGLVDSVFSPIINGIDSYSIVYTYSDTNGCVNSDTSISYVHGLPTVSLSGLDSSFCANYQEDTLLGLPSGGSYYGSGVSNNLFFPDSAGVGSFNIIYSYTDANNCTNYDTNSTVVKAFPVVTFSGLESAYCVDAFDDTLIASPVGGTFIGTVISGNVFSPSIAGTGNYEIIYNYTASNACSNSDTNFTIVHGLPTVNLSGLDPTYCRNNNEDTLFGLPSGGSYFGSGVSNNLFFPDSAGIGSFNIIYSYTDTNNCINYDTNSTLVKAFPVVTFSGLESAYCADAINDTLIANPIGGTFVGTGISGNVFSPSIAGSGNYEIIYNYTASNACSNSDTNFTIVHGLPAVSITSLSPNYCADALDVSLLSLPSGTGGVWSGTGVTPNNFSPYIAGVGAHTVYYTFTDSNYCSNIDSTSTIIHALPILDLGNDSTICANDSILLNAGTFVSYLWNNGDTTASIYVDSIGVGIDEAIYSVLITDTNSCMSIDSILITTEAYPTHIAQDTSLCGYGNNVLVDAGNIAGNSYVWSNGVMGSAILVDTTSLGATFGFIGLEIISANNCVTNDSVFVEFLELPNVNIGNDTSICWNHNYTLDAGAGFASYLWNTGATTQSITLDSNSFDIGNNLLRVEVYNDVNCNAMDSMILVVDPCTGVEMPELTNANINIYPNPTKGQFQIDVVGLENKEYNLDIYNSVGAVVYSDEVFNDGNNKQTWKLDFSTYAKGVYYVRLHSNGEIKVKRIIIN